MKYVSSFKNPDNGALRHLFDLPTGDHVVVKEFDPDQGELWTVKVWSGDVDMTKSDWRTTEPFTADEATQNKARALIDKARRALSAQEATPSLFKTTQARASVSSSLNASGGVMALGPETAPRAPAAAQQPAAPQGSPKPTPLTWDGTLLSAINIAGRLSQARASGKTEPEVTLGTKGPVDAVALETLNRALTDGGHEPLDAPVAGEGASKTPAAPTALRKGWAE